MLASAGDLGRAWPRSFQVWRSKTRRWSVESIMARSGVACLCVAVDSVMRPRRCASLGLLAFSAGQSAERNESEASQRASRPGRLILTADSEKPARDLFLEDERASGNKAVT